MRSEVAVGTKIFFREHGRVGCAELQPETAIRLLTYRRKVALSVQRIADRVTKKYGGVTDSSVRWYLSSVGA